MTKLEYLNKKVKEVDERFGVEDYNSEEMRLFFNNRPYCWRQVGVEGETGFNVRMDNISLKVITNQPLTDEEQLILKGIRAFYEAYNTRPKEYYIWMNNMFTPYVSRCLNLETEYLTYTFDNKVETGTIQTKFTEEEIDEMPTEIQKAIECGFLVKEEVDD